MAERRTIKSGCVHYTRGGCTKLRRTLASVEKLAAAHDAYTCAAL